MGKESNFDILLKTALGEYIEKEVAELLTLDISETEISPEVDLKIKKSIENAQDINSYEK